MVHGRDGKHPYDTRTLYGRTRIRVRWPALLVNTICALSVLTKFYIPKWALHGIPRLRCPKYIYGRHQTYYLFYFIFSFETPCVERRAHAINFTSKRGVSYFGSVLTRKMGVWGNSGALANSFKYII